MFKVTEGKGFHMTFSNGWTISVQWGAGNYGPNYKKFSDLPAKLPWQELQQELGAKGADVAEVGYWKEGSNGVSVLESPQTPEEVVRFMLELSTRKSDALEGRAAQHAAKPLKGAVKGTDTRKDQGNLIAVWEKHKPIKDA